MLQQQQQLLLLELAVVPAGGLPRSLGSGHIFSAQMCGKIISFCHGCPQRERTPTIRCHRLHRAKNVAIIVEIPTLCRVRCFIQLERSRLLCQCQPCSPCATSPKFAAAAKSYGKNQCRTSGRRHHPAKQLLNRCHIRSIPLLARYAGVRGIRSKFTAIFFKKKNTPWVRV